VVTADDGPFALETLKNNVPDVAFIDLVMPDIEATGYDDIYQR